MSYNNLNLFFKVGIEIEKDEKVAKVLEANGKIDKAQRVDQTKRGARYSDHVGCTHGKV